MLIVDVLVARKEGREREGIGARVYGEVGRGMQNGKADLKEGRWAGGMAIKTRFSGGGSLHLK